MSVGDFEAVWLCHPLIENEVRDEFLVNVGTYIRLGQREVFSWLITQFTGIQLLTDSDKLER